MAVAIRLTRVGATKRPAYRVIAIDKRRSRDGRALEILGFYDPLTDPATVQLDTDKIKAWIGNGAQPSDMVVRLMRQVEQAAAGEAKPKKAAKPKPSKKARAKAAAVETEASSPQPVTAEPEPEAVADAAPEPEPEAVADTAPEPVAEAVDEAPEATVEEAAADAETATDTEGTSEADATTEAEAAEPQAESEPATGDDAEKAES